MSKHPLGEGEPRQPTSPEIQKQIEALLAEHDKLNAEWQEISQRISQLLEVDKKLLRGPLSAANLSQLEVQDSEMDRLIARDNDIIDRAQAIEKQVADLWNR